MSARAIVVAGTASGVCKTTITLGLHFASNPELAPSFVRACAERPACAGARETRQ